MDRTHEILATAYCLLRYSPILGPTNAEASLRARLALQRQGAHGGGLCRRSRWTRRSSTPTPGRRNSSQANPLGKIPVLLTDDGSGLRQPGDHAVSQPRLRRRAVSAQRGQATEAERLEALADGICDCLLAHVYERRFRPEEKSAPALARQAVGEGRTRARPPQRGQPKLPKKLTAGHIALRATLGYLDLRFAGKWERGHAKLKRWAARFDEKFPELAPYLPSRELQSESRARGPAFATEACNAY